MSYAWIVVVVIILFIAYHFLKWYANGGKKQMDGIITAFHKEKDKILNGEVKAEQTIKPDNKV